MNENVTMPLLITIITIIVTLTVVTNELEKNHQDPVWIWEIEK